MEKIYLFNCSLTPSCIHVACTCAPSCWADEWLLQARWKKSTMALLYFSSARHLSWLSDCYSDGHAVRCWIGTISSPPTQFFHLQTALDWFLRWFNLPLTPSIKNFIALPTTSFPFFTSPGTFCPPTQAPTSLLVNMPSPLPDALHAELTNPRENVRSNFSWVTNLAIDQMRKRPAAVKDKHPKPSYHSSPAFPKRAHRYQQFGWYPDVLNSVLIFCSTTRYRSGPFH